MGRRPCCEKEGVNRGSWSAQEDKILEDYVKTHGEGKWRDLPKRAGLNRCGKSCRLRWLNYLRPDIKRGNISEDEEELIIKLHKLLGNRWSLIAGRLPGRTDNEIKNYWNTNLSKRPDQRQQKKNQSHNNFLDSGDIKPKNSRIKPAAAQTIKSSPESSPLVIRTKASKCTKVFVPLEAAAIDSTKLVNSFEDNDSAVPAADFENKMMNLVRDGTESQSSSTQQDDNNENFSDFLIDFDIGELLITDLPAGPSCCSNDQNTSELVQQSAGNIVIEGDQNGQSFNNCACLDLAAHFGDEANNHRLDHSMAEAMPENWMASGLLHQNEAEVDPSHFLNSE